MLELEVLDDPARATLALDPVKGRILAALTEAGSAASIAGHVGLTRQKVNYHLRALEAHGLVEPVEERQWGGLTERRVRASAAAYVLSPDAVGSLAADPDRSRDRTSAGHLIALAARAIREVGALWKRARREEKRLATLSLDAVIHFRSPAERAAFTAELAELVAGLAARYDGPDASGARAHRLLVASYPAPSEHT